MNHPIQPLEKDAQGILRFKQNTIVRYLLDHGGIDLNQLAALPFDDSDREQFAQLIGYSLSGFGELPYVSTETYETAARMDDAARIAYLEAELAAIKDALRVPCARLFNVDL